jgi:hypothetical protein
VIDRASKLTENDDRNTEDGGEQSGEPEPPMTRVLKSCFLAAARLPPAFVFKVSLIFFS